MVVTWYGIQQQAQSKTEWDNDVRTRNQILLGSGYPLIEATTPYPNPNAFRLELCNPEKGVLRNVKVTVEELNPKFDAIKNHTGVPAPQTFDLDDINPLERCRFASLLSTSPDEVKWKSNVNDIIAINIHCMNSYVWQIMEWMRQDGSWVTRSVSLVTFLESGKTEIIASCSRKYARRDEWIASKGKIE